MEDLDGILLELRRRVDERVDLCADGPIVADEVHSLSGLVEASAAAAQAHAREVRARIETTYGVTNVARA
jgi:hypothetical protein